MPQRYIPPLVSVERLGELHPESFPQTRTRDLIYHAEERTTARGEVIPPNGFGACFIRRAGRVLIDLDAVALWLEEGRGDPRALRRLPRTTEREAKAST